MKNQPKEINELRNKFLKIERKITEKLNQSEEKDKGM